MEDWKSRTALLVGPDGAKRLSDACVAVVGLGGVGSVAAEMVVRAGVGHLVILDCDRVSDTNRNRQIPALSSTVGRLKTEVVAERLKDINPELDLTVVDEYLDSGNVGVLSGFHIDYLIDAIDTLSPKLALICHCVGNHIPLVSSMGSGAKYDVTRIRITDISKSFNCPLAYIVRKKLRKMGITKGFKAVFSEELPVNEAIVELSEAEQAETSNKKSQVGTISYLPAAFGCACAQAALTTLLQP